MSIAAASLLTEYLKGKKVKDLRKMDERSMLKLVGINVTAGRMSCVLLPFQALERVIGEIDER